MTPESHLADQPGAYETEEVSDLIQVCRAASTGWCECLSVAPLSRVLGVVLGWASRGGSRGRPGE